MVWLRRGMRERARGGFKELLVGVMGERARGEYKELLVVIVKNSKKQGKCGKSQLFKNIE